MSITAKKTILHPVPLDFGVFNNYCLIKTCFHVLKKDIIRMVFCIFAAL